MTTHTPRKTSGRRSAADTREHILEVAHELFYFDGIRSTGVDTVAARAQIAPPTLYRLFGSKDELVAAYVRRCSARYKAALEAATGPGAGSPLTRILAAFDVFEADIRSGASRGCPFLMVLAEYPDPQSPSHQEAIAHKAWLRALFHALVGDFAKTEPVGDPERLAEQLALVAEGIYGSAQALGPAGPANQGRACAEALICVSRPDRSPAR
jgi:AcrR family transcriptional regulator